VFGKLTGPVRRFRGESDTLRNRVEGGASPSAATTPWELIELAAGGVRTARTQQRLLFGFLGQTGLTL
jgi:hypothetical protein